jgi:hypothetical protein
LTDATGLPDEFGSTVAISGNTVIVGAWYPFNLGSAYVFGKPVKGWRTTHTYQAKLMVPGETSDWGFGGSVTVDGSTSVVSADGWNTQGAAFVFGK